MLSKDIQNAIHDLYALNDVVSENVLIYVFPLDELILDPIISVHKDSIETIYASAAELEDDTLPYLVLKALAEDNGIVLFVFTAGLKLEKAKQAVLDIANGKEPE